LKPILLAFALVVVVFFILNFLRKLHWDAIQHNLLDLADKIGGSVLRKGILSRPIYHGRYRDIDLTINFSVDKSGGKRKNYIDISIGKNLDCAFTISSLDWIKESSTGSLEEFKPIELKTKRAYGIRQHKGKKLFQMPGKNQIKACLQELDPFRFLHASTNGMLFEKEGENLGVSTRHPNLEKYIEALYSLILVIENK
jgi:hypothetical protein